MESILTYVGPEELLTKNGFAVSLNGTVLCVHGPGTWGLLSGDFGVFAPMMLNYMAKAQSFGGVSSIPSQGLLPGMLWDKLENKQLVGLTEQPVLGYDKDQIAVGLFCSEAVYTLPGAEMVRLRVLFPVNGLGTVRAEEMEADLSSGFGSDPFYKVVDMSTTLNYSSWVSAIQRHGYSWNVKENLLFVSNTLSGLHGLAPNHRILGFRDPILALSRGCSLKVQNFFLYPSETALRAIMHDRVMADQFEEVKHKEAYSVVSRGLNLLEYTARELEGEQNAVTVPVLASLISWACRREFARCFSVLVLLGQKLNFVQRDGRCFVFVPKTEC